ncbi:MAG: glycosyltransferase [Clostridiales bacterium]|nr:glycosyltransferase [Clostridiales bacterium]
MDRISVVIPAYNCGNTIKRCVQSIQSQTYDNIQIVIVNDGSADNTESVLADLQSAYDNIKVISIPNGGVSHARNVGIDNADGDYIGFVDADDYVDPEMYETLIELIHKHGVKIAHCSYKNIEGAHIHRVGDTGRIIIQDHNEAIKCLLGGKYFIGSLCNKLYRKELFENVRLSEEIKFNEDILANFELFRQVDKSVYIDKAFYSYVSCEQSATHKSSSARSLMGPEQVALVARKISEYSKGEEYEYEATERYAKTSLNLYKNYVFFAGENINQKKKKLKPEIKKCRKYYTGKNDKVSYSLLMYFPWLYRLVYRVYSKHRVKKLDPEQ